MPNNIASTKNYTAILDEVYQREAVSTVLNSPRRLMRTGHNAKEIMIPCISVTGLGDYPQCGLQDRLHRLLPRRIDRRSGGPGLSRAGTCRGADRRSCAPQHKPPARHISQCLCRIFPVHNSPFVRLLRVDFRRGSTQAEVGSVTTMRGAPTYSSVKRTRKFSWAG